MVQPTKTLEGLPVSRTTARRVLEIESRAVGELADRLDHNFDRAVELLEACAGRVVVTGMGKSGLIGQKITATLSSTGQPANSGLALGSFNSPVKAIACEVSSPMIPTRMGFSEDS